MACTMEVALEFTEMAGIVVPSGGFPTVVLLGKIGDVNISSEFKMFPKESVHIFHTAVFSTVVYGIAELFEFGEIINGDTVPILAEVTEFQFHVTGVAVKGDRKRGRIDRTVG